MTRVGAATQPRIEFGDLAEHGSVAPPSPGLRVLMFALHFPPIAAAGTHRTLNFVRELAKRGHRVGVVTTSRFAGFRVEQKSLEAIPATVAVTRGFHVDPFLWLHDLRKRANGGVGTGGTSEQAPIQPPKSAAQLGPIETARDYLSRLADIPDRYASWILPAIRRGVGLAAELRPEVVYATAPPFSALLAGYFTAEVLGLPLVVDLRDPWAVNPFRSNPYGSLRTLDDHLESMVVERARSVILNTPLAERDYRARYGPDPRFLTIQNGIAPELFEFPRGTPESGGRFRLLHVGSIYGRRSPLALVRALERLRVTQPTLFDRLVIEQLGPVEDGGALLAALDRTGLRDKFSLRPAVSHREAFLECTRADALLLLGVSGEKPEVQVPAKLFEYLATERPVLALAKAGGAILATFERAKVACVAADPDDAVAIERALERLVGGSSSGAHRDGSHSDGVSVFRYENLARELETVLLRAARGA